jgi:hypothetical protein
MNILFILCSLGKTKLRLGIPMSDLEPELKIMRALAPAKNIGYCYKKKRATHSDLVEREEAKGSDPDYS